MTPHRTPIIRPTGTPALTPKSTHHTSETVSLTPQSPFLTALMPDHSPHKPPSLIPQTQSLTPHTPSVASEDLHHSPHRLLIAHLTNAPCSPYRPCITMTPQTPQYSPHRLPITFPTAPTIHPQTPITLRTSS